jgi:hypothetical protein
VVLFPTLDIKHSIKKIATSNLYFLSKRELNIRIPKVEVTVAHQLDQGARKKSAVYLFFLDFSLLLSLHQGKESR